MSKKTVTLEEGKLKGIKLHSLWLRERLTGKDFVDQNNLQRLYEPSLLDENLLIDDYIIEDQFLRISFSDGVKGKISVEELYKEINSIDAVPEKKIWDKMVGYTKSFLYLVGSLILMYAIEQEFEEIFLFTYFIQLAVCI